MRHNWLILILLILPFLFFSCSVEKDLVKADKACQNGEYTKAINAYQSSVRGIKNLEKKTEIMYTIAECYRAIGKYKRAGAFYKNASKGKSPDSTVFLRYGDMLRAGQKYEKAIEAYQAFLQFSPGDLWGMNGIRSCDIAPGMLENPTRFIVQNEKRLNSSANDFSPFYVAGRDNEVIFSTNRDEVSGRKKSKITGFKNGDLFVSRFEKQKSRWEKPHSIDTEMLVNTNEDEGAGSLTQKGDELFFTRCPYEKGKANGAIILKSAANSGVWTEPISLGIFGDTLIAAQPAISPDGNRLIFVSDKMGGYGGKDLWFVERSGGSWGKPKNMGEMINTPGDELFPYIRSRNEIYFSTNFRPGLGGLDIFKATKDEDNIWQVENMGSPINSSADDFGIVFAKDEERIHGMFSSNRKGSRLDDIWSFMLPPKIFEVVGELVNKNSEKKVGNAYVRVIGTDGTMLKVRSDDGTFKFKLHPETEYIFAAFKPGFLNSKFTASTIGLEESKTFKVRFELTPIDAPIQVDNIFYDLGKWELLPASISALDSLVEILSQNPTITIELGAHTDARGNAEFNSELSQKRAQSVVDYLIAAGVSFERLVAKGYGETAPKKVSKQQAEEYDFLNEGTVLTEEFINNIPLESERETAHRLNRRTEFKVISVDYREKFAPEELVKDDE